MPQRSTLTRISLPCLLVLGAGAITSPALAGEPSAADRETARSFVISGRSKLAAGDLQGALKAFAAAHEIMGVPTTGLDLAKAQAALGLLIDARATALEVTRMPPKRKEPLAFTEARPAAADLADALAGRIPSITIRVEGPAAGADVKILVDGDLIPGSSLALPRKVNPGAHEVEASAPGFTSERQRVTVKEGETLPVTITLAPVEVAPPERTAPAASPPDADGGGTPAWVWAAGATGLVAIGVGAVFAVDYVSVRSTVDEDCPGGACDSSRYTQAEADNLRSRWNRDLGLTLGLGAAGLAGVGVAIVGIATGPSRGERRDAARATTVTPWLSPRAVGAGLRGAF